MDINELFDVIMKSINKSAEGSSRTSSATAPALLYLLHPCSRVLRGIRASLFIRSPNSGCRKKMQQTGRGP